MQQHAVWLKIKSPEDIAFIIGGIADQRQHLVGMTAGDDLVEPDITLPLDRQHHATCLAGDRRDCCVEMHPVLKRVGNAADILAGTAGNRAPLRAVDENSISRWFSRKAMKLRAGKASMVSTGQDQIAAAMGRRC